MRDISFNQVKYVHRELWRTRDNYWPQYGTALLGLGGVVVASVVPEDVDFFIIVAFFLMVLVDQYVQAVAALAIRTNKLTIDAQEDVIIEQKLEIEKLRRHWN